jgi:MoaA/NifB/PqqE/SkfB family radical SAM enzyme
MAKRIEIYLGWKCTNDCIFCIEEKTRKSEKTITFLEVKKYLDDEAALGARHVTLLGGEPSIQEIFPKTIEYAKKIGYKICIATNGSAFVSSEFAKKYVPKLDEIIVSVHGHNNNVLDKITRRKNSYTKLERALGNIVRNFKGEVLKTNTVIMGLNHEYLFDIVKAIHNIGVKEIDLSAMDLYRDHEMDKLYNCLGEISDFSCIVNVLSEIFEYEKRNNLNIRVNDIPLCYLGDNMIKSGNLYYANRIKISENGERFNRKEIPPRAMLKLKACEACRFNDLCPGFIKKYVKTFPDQKVYPFK